MTALFTDDFNRANGALGSNWTSIGAAGTVSSNQYAAPSGDALDYWNGGSPPNAQYVEAATGAIQAAPAYAGICLRLNTTSFNWYAATWNTSGCVIQRYDGGVATTLGSNFTAPANGDVVKLEAIGSTLNVYYNNVLQATRTDSTYTTGRSGIQARGTAIRLDNFGVGNLVTAITGSASLALTASGTLQDSNAGQISGSASLSLSPSGTLTGKGALAGSATVTITPAATLTGAGALVGNAGLTITPQGALSGAGALNGSAALQLNAVGTLTDAGAGQMTGAASITFDATGSLTGGGALSGAIPLAVTPSGQLTGAGALAGAAAMDVVLSGTLVGVGAMSGSSSMQIDATGTLSGSAAGQMAGSAAVAFGASGVLTGRGALVGLCQLEIQAEGRFDQPQSQSGGGFWYHYELDADRRRRAKRKREDDQTVIEELQDDIDREIARHLHADDAEREKADDLARLQQMVARFADRAAEEALTERVHKAFVRAHTQQNLSAFLALDRELQRAMEEEEFLLLMALAN